MVRVSSPAKLRPWSELTGKMVMGVVPGLVTSAFTQGRDWRLGGPQCCKSKTPSLDGRNRVIPLGTLGLHFIILFSLGIISRNYFHLGLHIKNMLAELFLVICRGYASFCLTSYD